MGYASIQLAAALLAGAQQPAFELNEVQNTVRMTNRAPEPSPERPSGPMIAGLGELIFVPDPKDFPLESYERFKASNEYGLYSTVELGVRRDGSIATCIQIPETYRPTEQSNSALNKYLCNVIKQKARFQFADGLALPDAPGYLVINLTWAKQFTPKQPIQFAPKDKGFSAYFYVEPMAKAGSEQCGLYASEVSDEASQKICAALQASPAFKNRRAQFMRKRSAKSAFTASAWVLPDPAAPEQSLVKWSETKYDQNPPAYYDSAAYAENDPETSPSGQFFWTLKFNDRPDANAEIWDRYQAKAVLNLTINPDGSVQSCRPYQYSDAAVMDFKACAIAKQSGRFVVTNGTKPDKPYQVFVDAEWPTK